MLSAKSVCSVAGACFAAHVRTNHVHAVVEAQVRPEKILHAFKSYASRNLNRLGVDEPNRKRWARHGSTRWLTQGRVFSDELPQKYNLVIADVPSAVTPLCHHSSSVTEKLMERMTFSHESFNSLCATWARLSYLDRSRQR
jgi:hypothetical protein